MTLAQYAAENGLHRVGARPPLGTYLRDTWGRRDFLYMMARSRLRAGFEKNRLGIVWVVLRPTINAAIYGLIFGVLQGGAKPPDYTAYVVIGVFLFEFFSKSMNEGSKSITGNRALVQSLAFPRLTLPLAEVVENFMSLMPMIGVMFFYLIVLGHYPRWQWFMLIPLLAIFSVFNAGIAMIGARLTVHVADLTQLLPFVSRILFYTSGVLFDVNRLLGAHPTLIALYDFYPIYQVLQVARSVLMTGREYDPMYWLYLSIWAVVVFTFGLIYFWVAEERYGRD
jgi:teichoic acid transport system permease protein